MKRITRYITCALVAAAICVSQTPLAAAQQQAGYALPGLIISEVQTGGISNGNEDGKQEFVELYNPYDVSYSMDGSQLEYLSASHTGEGPATRLLTTLSGEVAPRSFVVVSYPGYIPQADATFVLPASISGSGLLARSGGHVRLVNAAGKTTDLVVWGTATDISPWWRSPEIPAGMSIQRILPGDAQYTTGLTYLVPTGVPTPGAEPSVIPEIPDPGTPPECMAVVLSELLPNAAGPDTGKEFIEVHNPTDAPVTLQGCQLQLEGGKSFALPNELLAAGGYRAFYDAETGLTLPNASAVTVRLTSISSEQSVRYADNMADGAAWAMLGGTWQVTTIPTPNAANVLGTSAPQESSPSTLAAPVPCAAGKERNPQTGRCRTVLNASSPTACKIGQERNPETNRCRLVTAVAAGPKPCKANQERNPETNRCRAVQAASTVKPCPAGQERNAMTNRCRKVVGGAAGQMATVKDVKGSTLASNYRWWIAGGLIISAAAYGIYEWRKDVVNVLRRVREGNIFKRKNIARRRN